MQRISQNLHSRPRKLRSSWGFKFFDGFDSILKRIFDSNQCKSTCTNRRYQASVSDSNKRSNKFSRVSNTLLEIWIHARIRGSLRKRHLSKKIKISSFGSEILV